MDIESESKDRNCLLATTKYFINIVPFSSVFIYSPNQTFFLVPAPNLHLICTNFLCYFGEIYIIFNRIQHHDLKYNRTAPIKGDI